MFYSNHLIFFKFYPTKAHSKTPTRHLTLYHPATMNYVQIQEIEEKNFIERTFL